MKRRRFRRFAIFMIMMLAIFVRIDGSRIVTEEFVIASDRIPTAFDGFRIVLIADLHGREFGAGNARLLDAVAAAKPGIIVLAGDLCDWGDAVYHMRSMLEALTGIAPVYYVSGNHEWTFPEPRMLFRYFEDCGMTVLRNESVELCLDESQIVLAGVEDPNGPSDQKTHAQLAREVRQAYPNAYFVVLSHRNDQLSEWSELGADLVLSGHGHGGLIRIPGVGGLIGSDRSLMPDYCAGHYLLGSSQMVVSRGLGETGVVPRVFNPPHLPVIVLQSVNNS